MAPVRQTRGRQRIPMRLIQNQDDLYASFSKRRLGLFKKAAELSTLCSADIGILVFSPTDNPFSFFSPGMDSVIERCMNPDQPTRFGARAIDIHSRAQVEDLSKRLDELVEEKLRLKGLDDRLDQVDKTRQKAWWEETAVDDLDQDQLTDWIAWFNNFKSLVQNRVDDMHQQNNQSAPNNAVPSFNFAAQSSHGNSIAPFLRRQPANINSFDINNLSAVVGGGESSINIARSNSNTHFFGGEPAANIINPFNISNLSGAGVSVGDGGGGESSNAGIRNHFFGGEAANINPFNFNNLSGAAVGDESSNARSSTHFFGREATNMNPFNMSGAAASGGGGESSNARSSTHFFGREAATMNPFNMSGAAASGGGESSNARSSAYFYRPMPSRTFVGSSVGDVFSPTEQYVFSAQPPPPPPPPTYLDQSGVEGSGAPVTVAPLNPYPSASFTFLPHYRHHMPSAAQNLSSAAETNEPITSNHQLGN